MRLIELRANKESFHTVTFNPTGISIIAATKQTEDAKKTYNSVGKSLTIALIHFCLGSDPSEDFLEKLKDWVFYLDFKIDSTLYTVERSVEAPDVVILNEKEYPLEHYKKLLQDQLFIIETAKPKYITFRGLISRFLRYGSDGYIEYDRYIKKEQPITNLINNACLLGLDINLILQKAELRDKELSIASIKKHLNKPEFKSLFRVAKGKKDLQIRIVNLEADVQKMKDKLAQFKVAEDYYEIKKQADDVSKQLKELQNKATQFRMVIENINKSLKVQPDITKEKLLRLYEEAKIDLSELIVKRLEDLEEFNAKILANRKKKLTQERKDFSIRLEAIENDIKDFADEEDKLLKYLKGKGALDDYLSVSQLLNDKEKELMSLKQYKDLSQEYTRQTNELKAQLLAEKANTDDYLINADELISNNITVFNSFVQEFYSDKTSGISITNNEGDNTLRFNIEAKIQDDAGNAVNEVKMFCYDWTILKGQHNHFVQFLFHDSKITGDMDPRQRLTMLKIANRETLNSGLQYIISLNEDTMDSIRERVNLEYDDAEKSESVFNTLVTNNIILRLSDKSDKDKLLGIQVDVDYEK